MTLRRFEELIGMLIDDEIGEDQIDELVTIVGEDPKKLEELRQHLNLSDRLSQYEDELRGDQRFLDALTLRTQTVGESDDFVERVVASSRRTDTRLAPTDSNASRRRSLGWIVAGIAATLAIVMFMLRADDPIAGNGPQWTENPAEDRSPEATDNGVAVLTRAIGLQGADLANWEPGTTLPPGMLAWKSGIIQLELYSGVTVVAEGPASVEIIDESQVFCRMGKLRVHVPKVATGFSILTPHVEVVDRGTDFGIEVSESGTTSIRVFDGRVELFDVASGRDRIARRELTGGDAVVVGIDGRYTSITSRDTDFMTPDRFQELTTVENRHRLQRWQDFRDQLKHDPRVIAYFPFERDPEHDRTLIGYAGGEVLEGAIVGCEWSEGRWREKSSLEFKRPGDRVRIDIPGEYESLTYAAWLRLDGLDREFNSLLLTDGYGVNRPHWQIGGVGDVLLGVRYPVSGTHSYRSKRIFNTARLGQWVHMATVYDSGGAEVRHYVNGAVVSREPFREPAHGPLSIGDATIGNWGRPTDRHQSKIRNLNGRLGELVIFARALQDTEIHLIYAAGKP